MIQKYKPTNLGMERFLVQATKNKISDLTQAVVDEVKAPPTPRDETATVKNMKKNASRKKPAEAKTKTESMPPPQHSIQQPRVQQRRGSDDNDDSRAESVRRRRGFMDSKLGSTNKKAVKDDLKTALAKKAGYL